MYLSRFEGVHHKMDSMTKVLELNQNYSQCEHAIMEMLEEVLSVPDPPFVCIWSEKKSTCRQLCAPCFQGTAPSPSRLASCRRTRIKIHHQWFRKYGDACESSQQPVLVITVALASKARVCWQMLQAGSTSLLTSVWRSLAQHGCW